MSVWNWIKILAKILELIAEGQTKDQAVRTVSAMSGVSASEIWKKGGF